MTSADDEAGVGTFARPGRTKVTQTLDGTGDARTIATRGRAAASGRRAAGRRPRRRRPPLGRRAPPLPLGGPVQHDPRHADRDGELLDRAHLAARDLPRHRAGPAGARERRLPALDDHGLPAGQRGPRGHARPARRHLRAGAHVQPRLRRLRGGVDRAGAGRRCTGSGAALWIIGWRLVQAVGGAMLFANSAAILTDAFPARPAGHGARASTRSPRSPDLHRLVLGGVLSESDWRACSG